MFAAAIRAQSDPAENHFFTPAGIL